MKILTDFKTDIANEFKKELEFYGYKNIPNDADEIIADYFCAIHKMISPVPRKIKKSDVFSCPEEAAEGFAFLERKIESGDNLCPHQSEAVLDLKTNDLLFYDWGIQHLHLGIELKENGFAERSKYVLYVCFTKDSAYFLNVLDHGEWTNRDFSLIMERNWPEIMEPYRMVGFEKGMDEKAMKKLRKIRGSFLTEVNGKVYAPIGGGYSTARTSLRSTIQSDRFMDELNRLEEWINHNEDEIWKSGLRHRTDVSELNFIPTITEGTLTAFEPVQKISIF